MRRRDFLTQGALAAGALVARGSMGQTATPRTVRVTIKPEQTIGKIAPAFMGLGYEISSVARPGLLSAANHVYVQLVRGLGAEGVIRVGGNTSDYASYKAKGPAVSRPKGTVVDERALKDLGGFLRATGWKLIWGLNLGSGSVENALAEAEQVRASAGDKLLAFEIGNEPDLFVGEGHRRKGYSYADWLGEYRRYKKALRAKLPPLPLAGPDAALGTDWVTRFAADEGKDAVLLTHHYYRGGQSDPTTSIAKLLGGDPKLDPMLARLRAASRSSGVPYRICEVNSFSGGGRPGVSDTMAGALWALDYMYTLASYGCSGVNMETGVNQLGFISPYSPIGDNERGHYGAKPEYYGMLAFALGGRGQMLATTGEGGGEAIKVYATKSPAGLMVTCINKGDAAATVVLRGGPDGPALVTRLEAPAVTARSGVTLGRATVDARGVWKPGAGEKLRVGKGSARVALPAYSAAMVSMG